MMKRFSALLLALMLLVTAVPAMADTPKPIETIPYEEIPASWDGQYHYLLLCTDSWKANPNNLGNTDGIVIVTLDTRAHRVMLTSIIRDALVVRPDGVIGRINYIAKNYGPEALCKVISQHLNVKLEDYILFDFGQIARIIDHLGGVDIEVDSSEASYLRRYPLESHQTSPAMGRAGTYKFYGRAAVIYMRIRKAGGGGDFMRTQRVRTVLSTLADQCRDITYEQAETLLDAITENTLLTNMNPEKLVAAMDQAYSLRDCTIEELRLPQDDAVHPINYANMSAQEVDWAMCREDFEEYLTSSWLVMDEE
ncbi:MAG: LytR family transcriptional regulator [Clostridiales bacterium]|nr:LytR family transcriptional regulator [Clostridiales bacterium]